MPYIRGDIMNIAQLAYKEYKNAPISKDDLDSLITVLLDKKTSMLDSNISKDILFMNELDKMICIYLKKRISKGDIDAEIYMIEKYKYVFSLPKIIKRCFSIQKKEDIILKALEGYNGSVLFSKFLVDYIKLKYLSNEKINIKKIDIQKLKQFLSSKKDIIEQKNNIDTLYSYFFDVEDLLNDDFISDREKAIILLKFGYINFRFCDISTISNILNIDYDEVEKVYQENQKKLQKVCNNDFEEHYLNK